MHFIPPKALRAVLKYVETVGLTIEDKYDIAADLNLTLDEVEAAIQYVLGSTPRIDAKLSSN